MAQQRKPKNLFFGTPVRALITLGTAGGILALAAIRPDLIELAVSNLLYAVLNAVSPFLPAIITLGLVVLGFNWLFKPFRSSSKKKKGDH